mgnify:FL=1
MSLPKQMKRLAIIVIALSVRQIQADTPWRFQGSVVDGLDSPVEGALIHVFNGHMAWDKFAVDSESSVTSRCDGSFVGFVSGEHANTYRRITKAPYDPVEECGNWCTNGVVRLLRKRQFTTDDIAQLASSDRSTLYSNVVFILSYDWRLEEPLCLFPLGNRVRPAVLKALRHPSEHIRSGAKRLLRQHIFHPEDMDYAAENSPKRPKERITHADIDQAIKGAVTYVTKTNHYVNAATTDCLMNNDESEALVFFRADARVNDHAAGFYIHLSKDQSAWRFDTGESR